MNAVAGGEGRRAALADHAVAALEALRSRPLRSALTVLGIVIAATGVIAVVSVIQGFQRVAVGQLEELGSTYVLIMPHAPPIRAGRPSVVPRLTWDDGRALRRRVPEIARLAPVIGGRFTVEHSETLVNAQVIGVGMEWQEVRNHFIDRGRFFSDLESRRRRKVVVLGREMADRLDLGDRPIGAKVSVSGVPMTVIGVLEKKGLTLGHDPDQLVIVPFRTGLLLFGASAAERVELHVQVAQPALLTSAVDKIEAELRRRHEIEAEHGDDFEVMLQDEILDSVEILLTAATAVVAGVVGIALLVGGVGIMNIMLVTVTERTAEIGLRKAVGARRRDVLIQFLFEAAFLSLAGGALGIGLGYLLGYALSRLLPGGLPPAVVPLWIVVGALAFCAAIGVVSGLYPAARAASLRPIESLRYE